MAHVYYSSSFKVSTFISKWLLKAKHYDPQMNVPVKPPNQLTNDCYICEISWEFYRELLLVTTSMLHLSAGNIFYVFNELLQEGGYTTSQYFSPG